MIYNMGQGGSGDGGKIYSVTKRAGFDSVSVLTDFDLTDGDYLVDIYIEDIVYNEGVLVPKMITIDPENVYTIIIDYSDTPNIRQFRFDLKVRVTKCHSM